MLKVGNFKRKKTFTEKGAKKLIQDHMHRALHGYRKAGESVEIARMINRLKRDKKISKLMKLALVAELRRELYAHKRVAEKCIREPGRHRDTLERLERKLKNRD